MHPKESVCMYTLKEKKIQSIGKLSMFPQARLQVSGSIVVVVVVVFNENKAYAKLYHEQTDRQTDGQTDGQLRVST